jgi:two-component system OmpR family sensor kinase
MTLARRISIMVGLVIGFTAFAMAVLAAFSGRATSFEQVDSDLNELRSAATASEDPVRTLLQILDAAPSDVVTYLQVDEELPFSLVDDPRDSADGPFATLTPAELEAAQREPITLRNLGATRLFSVSLGEGQWLIVGTPVDDVLHQFRRQLLINSLIAVVLAVLGGALSAVLARQALAPVRNIIDYSRAVAAGELEVAIANDATSRDIRELQGSIAAMVESLRDAAERTARSEADMRTFLADVAHELRTPLTTVRAYADVLATTTPSNPEVRDRAQHRIAHESRRMSRLIDDLLLLARLASTKLGNVTKFDVSEVIQSHFSDLSMLDPDRNVVVTCTSVETEGDRALIERLFANLVSNIHRHTPSTARVTVSCWQDEAYVHCRVDDAGPGLGDAQLRELADGTRRFGTRRSDDQHGSGLGLHLVSSIAASHGGTATFGRSDLGGLCVDVRLPKSAQHPH